MSQFRGRNFGEAFHETRVEEHCGAWVAHRFPDIEQAVRFAGQVQGRNPIESRQRAAVALQDGVHVPLINFDGRYVVDVHPRGVGATDERRVMTAVHS